jgi:hypothetical protein
MIFDFILTHGQKRLKGVSVCPPTYTSNFDEKIAGQPMKKFLSQIFFQGEAKKGGGQIT